MRRLFILALLLTAREAQAQAVQKTLEVPPVLAKTTETTVTNAANGTYVPGTTTTHSPLAARRAIEIQNLGPNAIYCTVDGVAPVALKARKIPSMDTWSLNAGPTVAVRCIADVAAQVTTAATITTELR